MAGSGEPSGAAVVATGPGRVRGTELDGLLAWRGVPYAQPPSGELRFRPPQAPAAWDGVRDCTRPAPVAWQSEGVNPFTGQPVALDRSEDCLYVNVTAPSGPPVAPGRSPGAGLGARRRLRAGIRAGELIGDGAAWPGSGWSSSPSTTGSVRSGSSTSTKSRTPAGPASWTRSRRCAGCTRTSPRSAATPAASRSTACPRAPRASRTCWRRR